MSTEAILQILENGKWHQLQDIKNKTNVNIYKVESVIEFLVKYNFVKINNTKVKIDSSTNRFFKKIKQLENKKEKIKLTNVNYF